MEPLSCKNCCHNPLQLGSLGTAFGFCTRHRQVLAAPHLTTCGQLLRKDLLSERAASARIAHAKAFRSDVISMVMAPARAADDEGLVSSPIATLHDAVVDEVLGYGTLPSKFATIWTLHRMDGARAEVASLSLGRAYFRNCFRKDKKWTAGVHLLVWSMQRLTMEPMLLASDVQGPNTLSVERYIEIAKWDVMFLRVLYMMDVAEKAQASGDPVGELAVLLGTAIEATTPGSATSLLRWFRRREAKVNSTLPASRYEKLRKELHQELDQEAG